MPCAFGSFGIGGAWHANMGTLTDPTQRCEPMIEVLDGMPDAATAWAAG
jgi:hypothetical protein